VIRSRGRRRFEVAEGTLRGRKRHTDREVQVMEEDHAFRQTVPSAFEKLAFGMTSAVRNCLLAAPRAGLAYAPVKRRRSLEGPRRSNGR
jgi:hypothetical protein